MTVATKLTIAAFAAALGALIAPAFAQNGSSDMQSRHDRGMSMGHMGQGMMGGRMMSGSMMAGCAGMMQSMNNGGDGRPNSQWQKRPPETPDNGG
jgi:uncharacterized protein YidB (DUF937 family)